MAFPRSLRPLDVAIAVAASAVLLLGAYLGLSVWDSARTREQNTPAARAIAQLSAEVKAKPNDIDRRMRLAQALAVAGRTDDAVGQYKQALKLNKEFVPALSGLGFLALQSGDYKTGEKYFRKVIDLRQSVEGAEKDSILETAYFYLGSALMEQRDYEDAASYFKEALRIRRDSSDSHYLLSVCFKKLGRTSSQKESLENTLLFDPKMPEANYDYGLLLKDEGDLAGAAEAFRRSADAAPGEEKPLEALDSLGNADDLLEKAQTSAESSTGAALTAVRIASALDPQSVDALVLAGQLYEKTKNLEQARDAYRRALAIEPENALATAGMKRVSDGS